MHLIDKIQWQIPRERKPDTLIKYQGISSNLMCSMKTRAVTRVPFSHNLVVSHAPTFDTQGPHSNSKYLCMITRKKENIGHTGMHKNPPDALQQALPLNIILKQYLQANCMHMVIREKKLPQQDHHHFQVQHSMCTILSHAMLCSLHRLSYCQSIWKRTKYWQAIFQTTTTKNKTKYHTLIQILPNSQ